MSAEKINKSIVFKSNEGIISCGSISAFSGQYAGSNYTVNFTGTDQGYEAATVWAGDIETDDSDLNYLDTIKQSDSNNNKYFGYWDVRARLVSAHLGGMASWLEQGGEMPVSELGLPQPAAGQGGGSKNRRIKIKM